MGQTIKFILFGLKFPKFEAHDRKIPPPPRKNKISHEL